MAVACAGANPERAEAEARRLLREGAGALLSFGIAGGLDPQLQAGAVVVATRVHLPAGGWVETERSWRERLVESIQEPVVLKELAGVDAALTTVAAKRALFGATRAAAVDLESHAVARVAAQAGVPMLAVRAVADPAERAPPPWVLGAVRPSGRATPWPVLAALCVKPWRVSALWAVAADTRRALGALRRVAATAPLLLGLDIGERFLDV